MVVWLDNHKKRERPCDGNLLIVLWLITLEAQILLSALGWTVSVKFYFVPLSQKLLENYRLFTFKRLYFVGPKWSELHQFFSMSSL